MKIAILYNEPTAGAAADEADVLVQVDAVERALQALGHHAERIGCSLDLGRLVADLARSAPDVVFNLAEGLAGHDRLYAVVPSLLDALRVPYTGCPAEAVFVTTSKLLAKERLRAARLPTPAAPARWPELEAAATLGDDDFRPGRYILKPVWEHGSVGMLDSAVVDAATRDDLAARLAAVGERTGRACFAEAFVAGRELNLSLLTGAERGPILHPGAENTSSAVEVLPPAEIDFSAFPADKPRIVGWAAKWDEGSFEYRHTPRRFELPREDQPLLARLAELARECWRVFELEGYARVDFRVAEDGQPYILEINTNPCLSPDAGFAAAVERAGLRYEEAIGRLLAAAMRRSRHAVTVA